MGEILYDQKSFLGLNFSPWPEASECQICCHMDDMTAPALRTAGGIEAVMEDFDGEFQGAWVENGQVRATVCNDVLHFGEKTFTLKALGKPRRFLRISKTQILIQPDMYVLYPEWNRCYAYDRCVTALANISCTNNVMTVDFYGTPPETFCGSVYVEGLSLSYYDEEKNPDAYLLYFHVTSSEYLGIDHYRFVLTPVSRNEVTVFLNYNESNVTLTLRQVMPEITHAAVCRNRLWGVAGNKLVASKLGNPLVFDDFSGLSTDSFELPMEEEMTAVTHFGERVVAFSRTALYELYGDRPSNYQISAAKFGGCTQPFSICNAGGYLIYADDAQIYRYGGGDPQPVGERLELPEWSEMFGVSNGETCLLGMHGAKWRLFRFRPAKGRFFELDFAPNGGFFADGNCYLFHTGGLYRTMRARRKEEKWHYRSGWMYLNRLGENAPRELCLYFSGDVERVSLAFMDGGERVLSAAENRGDGILRFYFPADLTHRVVALDLCGHGDACLSRILLRG